LAAEWAISRIEVQKRDGAGAIGSIGMSRRPRFSKEIISDSLGFGRGMSIDCEHGLKRLGVGIFA
jgi:hypothetical protein